MSIIYSISMIILFILVLLVKKSKEKLEITKTIFATLTIGIAYNILVCYILNLINIPITLLNLSAVNLIIMAFIEIKIFKDKTIQKYYFQKRNLIAALLIFVVTAGIIFVNFGNLTKMRYISMDGREHYKVAREFSENTSLSNKAVENNTVGPTFMPAGYINEGILFKVFNPYFGTANLYKIYILLEAYIYFLAGIMFYFAVDTITTKNNKMKIAIAIIFSIIYALGYLLNAWISGFHYLVIGIMFVTAIIYAINEIIEKDKIDITSKIVLMALLNIGLIFSYCLFCPFVYLAECIYFIYKYWKNNKAELIINIIIALLIPGMMGVTYLIFPNVTGLSSGIALEGYVYKNIWSNFILFVPFSIYYFYCNIKERKIKFDNIMLILLLGYMILLFIGTKIGKCSQYYFYKNYYIIWILIIYSNIMGMLKFAKEDIKKKIIVAIYTILYIIILLTSIFTTKTYIMQEANDSIKNTMEIFTFNKTMAFTKNAEFVTKDELELYANFEKVIGDNWKQYKNNEILFITNPTQERWIQSLTGYENILYDGKEFAIENLKNNYYKYLVISENRKTYEELKEYINLDTLEKIYENNNQKIYVLKGE